jgi:FdrA protein
MTVIRSEVRPGAYFDSAVLMRLQRALAELPGILDAGVVMATPANCELLDQSGLLESAPQAGSNDLLIVVKGQDEGAAASALGQVEALLRRRSASAAGAVRPRTLASAARQLPEAGWVLVSVPGRYAAGVAREALDLGKHVFLYSDNVSLADEVELKQAARAKGLLVMGPDCGTAIINGVGLGFANRVRRGPIGLVGASGTGLQAVTAEIHNLGSGVSQAFGTGGRDLKDEVGGTTAAQALDLLARDPDTNVIVLVSKPPSPEVGARLLGRARASGKAVVVNFIGVPAATPQAGPLHFANSLRSAAALAVQLSQAGGAPAVAVERIAGYVRGLFSGGTLAYEALLGLQSVLAPLYSNVPLREAQRLPDPLKSQGHTVLDLGEDLFTVGRLHPMMDNDLRLRRLRQEAADPDVGLILLDVVLGEGAHPDPASELAPAIAAIKRDRGLDVAAIVVGTDEDPQNLGAQVERLQEAGARVFRSVDQAIDYVGQAVMADPGPAPSSVSLDTLAQPLAALNVGLESFYDSLTAQGATAVHVDWRPPAGGNERLMGILDRLKKR